MSKVLSVSSITVSTFYIRYWIFEIPYSKSPFPPLPSSMQSEGIQTTVWDGRQANGTALSSGVYLVRFKAGDANQTRTVIYVR